MQGLQISSLTFAPLHHGFRPSRSCLGCIDQLLSAQQSTEIKFAQMAMLSAKEQLRGQCFLNQVDGIVGPTQAIVTGIRASPAAMQNKHILQARRHDCLVDIEDYLNDDSTGRTQGVFDHTGCLTVSVKSETPRMYLDGLGCPFLW